MSVENFKKKQVVIDEIKDKFSKAQSAVVVDYLGITVAEADDMRRKLREADVDYKVYKNKMIARAIEGTEFSELNEVLKGSTAIAFSYEDAIAPARVLNGIIKDYKKMAFKAGFIDGKYCSPAEVEAIAVLPSREELIAKFLGSIRSPLSSFAYLVQAIADQGGVSETAAEAAPEAPAEESAAEVPAVEAAPEQTEEPVAEEAAPAEEEKTEE